MFTFIDLFSGIGGMRMAFESVGGQCVYSCEIDKFARKTYQANFDVTERFDEDINDLNMFSLPDFDVLVAGFPCQPFSKAGESKNRSLGRKTGFLDQTRGTLFFKIAQILYNVQPKAFLLENVKGLVSHDNGNTFAIICDTLRDIGYNIDFEILNSEAFVPQKRERLFISGIRNEKKPIQLFGLDRAQDRVNPTLESILETSVDDKYTLSDKMMYCLQTHKNRQEEKGNGFGYSVNYPQDVARTLLARYFKDGSEILIHQDGKNPRRLTPRECARLMGFPDSFQIVVSDTQAYKQFGNAVVVPLVAQIANRYALYVGRKTKISAIENDWTIDDNLLTADSIAVNEEQRFTEWATAPAETIAVADVGTLINNHDEFFTAEQFYRAERRGF